jgi:uncharacterized protein YutE (UPF0331/DUF86 family)
MNFTTETPAFILTKCSPVWPYLESLNKFLIESRKIVRQKDIRTGINYTIILNTACCVEGILEYILKEILFQKSTMLQEVKSKEFHQFYYSLEKEIHTRIAKTTGINNYNYLFKLLIGKELSKINIIKPYMEGINVLFEFRNVLAHGREIKFESFCIDITNKEYYDSFIGGYKKAEDYLLKKKIINVKYANCRNDIYFTNKVADHFWKLSYKFINAIIKSLDADLKKLFIL